MLGTHWTMNYKNILQWTTMTLNNANNDDIMIMATITILNVTIPMTTMNSVVNGLMNNDNEQW